ncbi:hypothetical protein QBC46DRAFT_393125 [Diplogelasinospora grovesii]|uniref:Guanine nucleotide-exchange factor SEC12 n=1 Tax=Diplogelasinospora grovesii TaxID=303347 RepID=A0AAN6N1C3_9PEZI|nr:hypothetical protein QBC46DRAFT_393125 [Diplogelasinospora grovesii]
MAPTIPSTELKLSYPLYACDFDPQDANKLIVGGGGGAGRSGVGNKISVLDVSPLEGGSVALHVASELDLSRDEDSVTSLAVAGTRRRNNSLLVYAGINSSPDNLKKGKNEHFRVFSVEQASKTKSTPKISEVSRHSLFTSTSTDTDTYQRLLRLSPTYPGSENTQQIGAVATGLSKEPHIAVFDIPSTGTGAPKLRGNLQLAREAMDLDIIQVSEDEWQLVYCDDYEMYTLNIGPKGNSTDGPKLVFTMPDDDSTGRGRPSFRCIRYLTPTFVLCLSNIKGGGAVLQGFRLPKAEQGDEARARLAASAHLPKKNVQRAMGMAVRNLSPPQTPTQKQGDTQFVIAITAQDSSITLFTLEHQTMADISLIVNLYPVTTLKEVHPGPISGLTFSPLTAKNQSTLKLASIGSMGNTCVVHSLPLKKWTDKAGNTRRGGPPRSPRYILALKSQTPSITGLIIFTALLTLLVGLFVQGWLEVKGIAHPRIGARSITPASWHSPNYKMAGDIHTHPHGHRGFLAEYLAEHQLGGTGAEAGKKVLVLDENPVGAEGGDIKVERHDEITHAAAKEWQDLRPEERQAWKEKLKAAGHWGEEMGETIFKGILFSELGGLVGAMVG